MKKINYLLKKFDELGTKLHDLEREGKLSPTIHDTLYDDFNGKFTRPPKKACLKISQILKLHKLRHKGMWKKDDYILVIEPQNYAEVTKLTPNNFMFEKNIIKKEGDNIEVGYFHSGKSRLAQSGDGGDYGDLWWLPNESLIAWIEKNLKIGQKIIKDHT